MSWAHFQRTLGPAAYSFVDGTLAVTDVDECLVAVDLDTGDKTDAVFGARYSGTDCTSAIVPNDNQATSDFRSKYIVDGAGVIYNIPTVATGEPTVTATRITGEDLWSTAIVPDERNWFGTLCFAGRPDDGPLYLVSSTSGKDFTGRYQDEGIVAVAIDPADGNILWQRDFPVGDSLALTAGCTTDPSGNLVALASVRRQKPERTGYVSYLSLLRLDMKDGASMSAW